MAQASARDDATAGLVGRARAGDREAYDRLFALAADRALLFIRLRLGRALRTRVDSMDVLQDVYLEAHRAFHTFEYRGEGALARWLCRIGENCIRALADHHGAANRSPPTGAVALSVSDVIERARAPGTGPRTAAHRAETRERLARAIEQLADEERDAVLLRHFEELTVDEAAHRLGRSPSAVRRLIGRATARLGTLLRAREGGGDAGAAG